MPKKGITGHDEWVITEALATALVALEQLPPKHQPRPHMEDIRKLLTVLESLVDKGNTVIVIEHNLDVIKTSDWIVDMGPGGGVHGGEVLYSGPLEPFLDHVESPTADELRRHLRWPEREALAAAAQ